MTITREQKLMLWVLLVGQMLMWTLYGNITTFYPSFVDKHHKSINTTLVGVILAMFEASVLLSSPLVSMTLQKVGRKRFIIIGNSCMIFATVGFGLTYHV
jgi:MFS family permease